MESQGGIRKHLNAWLRIIRVPNLFTVPGDCLAGALLAMPLFNSGLINLVIASLCIYTAGLLSNDWFDREVDKKERPGRPIPSGAIKSSHVIIISLVLFLLSITSVVSVGFFPLLTVAILVILVLVYNSSLKNIIPFGFLALGACRGLNIILGASPSLPHLSGAVVIAAVTEGLYIIMVSVIAFNETSRLPSRFTKYAPLFVLIAGLIIFYSIVTVPWYVYLCATIVVIRVGSVVVSLKPSMKIGSLPGKIGTLIRLCILIQLIFILSSSANIVFSLVVLMFWVASELFGKKFAGS